MFAAALLLLVHAPVVHAVDGFWSPLTEPSHEQEAESEEHGESEPPSPENDDRDVHDDIALVEAVLSPPRDVPSARQRKPQLRLETQLPTPFLDPEVPPPRRCP